MKLETLEKNKEAMLKEYEATVLGDAEAGRPDPGRNGATLLLSVDEHRLVALAMHEFAVELITDAADASEGGIVRRTESTARSGSAGGAVQGAAAERAYHLNLKYGVETKDMITGPFKDAAAGDLRAVTSIPPWCHKDHAAALRTGWFPGRIPSSHHLVLSRSPILGSLISSRLLGG
jgi:hypothetical protein